MPPRYGPFYSSFAHEKTRESLASVSMLCCSEALAKYVRRHSPVDAIPCYYADYAYYGPPNASYLRGDAAPPLDARDKRPFDVLCVSPAGPKGLALLLAVAKALPAYRFVCVKIASRPDTVTKRNPARAKNGV